MTNIMSLKADVHYWWVPFTLRRRLALKDYWANRAPEKTCTPQAVIGALIEGITWEPRLLSEAANCCHCQKFSTKSSGHGRMSHRGRRRGRCLSTAHPSWITWARHHITLNPGWPQSWGEAAVNVEEKKKGSRHSLVIL